MSLINISNLTFAYDGSYDNIFTDVSFQIDTDWKLGFCGRNGRGKTTFLNLLMGRYEYQGSITASVDFEYFPFAVNDLSLNTQDILAAIAPETQVWQILTELSKLSVGEDTLYRPFSTLSNGERTKALLAGLFLRENSFLLIDEPTNHLDMEARENVAQYLNGKTGYILVSHDRAFLDGCVNHILSINRANIEIQKGNFSSWFHNKQKKDDFELATNEKLKKDIKRLKSAARQSSLWADKVESTKMGKGAAAARKKGHIGMDTMAYNAEKSRRMQQRRKNIERRQQSAIDEKSTLLKNIETAEPLKIHALKYHTSRLLTAENLSVSYDGREVFRELSFSVEQGDRLALQGSNGSGKSSIIKLICGENISHTGFIDIGSRLIISYVPQDASFLTGDLDEYVLKQQIDMTLFKTILRKLDFSRVQFEKDMCDFSAGQKKKVLLARSLCQQAHIYIWDEPLNYIDVLSRMQIEELISDYCPTMIFVEHDRAFCENNATKTINLTK
ncbi:MAG: ABC-F type ribosomal protection protein [Oscillospiraceae bacterium]|jgi:lincosamide and streptogramin A transport system ATP-binding/permease protein|nr:ABC-F type ribosomal protection protein [Oscillospiraceae bacterium]